MDSKKIVLFLFLLTFIGLNKAQALTRDEARNLIEQYGYFEIEDGATKIYNGSTVNVSLNLSTASGQTDFDAVINTAEIYSINFYYTGDYETGGVHSINRPVHNSFDAIFYKKGIYTPSASIVFDFGEPFNVYANKQITVEDLNDAKTELENYGYLEVANGQTQVLSSNISSDFKIKLSNNSSIDQLLNAINFNQIKFYIEGDINSTPRILLRNSWQAAFQDVGTFTPAVKLSFSNGSSDITLRSNKEITVNPFIDINIFNKNSSPLTEVSSKQTNKIKLKLESATNEPFTIQKIEITPNSTYKATVTKKALNQGSGVDFEVPINLTLKSKAFNNTSSLFMEINIYIKNQNNEEFKLNCQRTYSVSK